MAKINEFYSEECVCFEFQYYGSGTIDILRWIGCVRYGFFDTRREVMERIFPDEYDKIAKIARHFLFQRSSDVFALYVEVAWWNH